MLWLFLFLSTSSLFHNNINRSSCYGWNGRRHFPVPFASSSRGGAFALNRNKAIKEQQKAKKKNTRDDRNNDLPSPSSLMHASSSSSASPSSLLEQERTAGTSKSSNNNEIDDNLSFEESVDEVNDETIRNEFSASTGTGRDDTRNVPSGTSLMMTRSGLGEVEEQQPSKKTKSSFIVLGTGLTLLSACSLTAKLGILPGMPVINNENGLISSYMPYTDVQLLQDVSMTVITTILAYSFVKINTYSVSINKLQPRDARKLIHTFSAPLFILLWPFFTTTGGSRIFACIVPILNAIRLYLASTNEDDINKTKDGGTINTNGSEGGGIESELALAVSRSGSASEALGGPFIYVIMLLCSVLLFWKDDATAAVAVSCMAAGDGTADLIGRRYGKYQKWPSWINNKKSIAGSTAFFVSSTITALALVLWLQYWDCFNLSISNTDLISRVAFISFVTALLEVVPFKGFDDNYTVPISAAVLSILLL